MRCARHFIITATLPCSALIVLSSLLSGCIMDGPFVDQDIDKLVSHDSAVGWAPKGSPAPVTPLAIPVAQTMSEASRREAENSVVGAPLLVNDPTKKLSLTDCLDQALSNSPVTRGVWESARATAATVGIADAAYMPQIAFTGAMGPQKLAEAPLVVSQTAGTAAIGMNWVLMDFGRRDADSARAGAQLIAANYTFNRTMQKLVYDVQNAYFTLDAKISLREAARENVATARKQLDATDDRMTVGLATRPEVLQARQQYLQTLYDLENAKSEVFTAQAALAVVMGIPADRAPNILTLSELPLPDSLTKGVDIAIQSALDQRPDIASAISDVRAFEQKTKRAEADFLPVVSFAGGVGVTGNDFTYTQPGTNGGSDAATVGTYSAQLTGSWLLFDGYERANVLRQARSEVRVAEAKLEQLRLVTTGQVWASYFDFFSAQKRYEAGVALLVASQDSYDSVYQNYLNGLATINDLLLAESFLFDSRFELIKSRAQLLTASATFVLALGS